MDSNPFVTRWIDQVKQGDSDATVKLWQEYYKKLVGMARKRMEGASLGISDEEDIAISVFESFYRAAKNGRFPDLNSRDDLWKLLLRMSARKIIDRNRYANRVRRQGSEVSLNQTKDDDAAVFEVMGNEPTPEMVAMLSETCEALLSSLEDENLRLVAASKMEGYSNGELAEKFGCSERTIERRLNLIRKKLSCQL